MFKSRKQNAMRLLKLFAIVALMVIWCSSVSASTGGGSWKFDQALQKIADNLEGPVTKAVVGIGLFIAGATYMLTRHEVGGGKVLVFVVGSAILMNPTSFLTFIGFQTALI